MRDQRIGPTAQELEAGVNAYAAYGAAVGWKTYSGAPMPPWFDLGPQVQSGWVAVGRLQTEAVSRETSLVPPLVAVLIDEHQSADGHLSATRVTELVRALMEVYGYGS